MNYAVIPPPVLASKALSHTDVVVYGAITTGINVDGECRYTNLEISERCNCARMKVARSIESLSTNGLVSVGHDENGRVITIKNP